MNKFLKKVCLFLIAPLLIVLISDFYLRNKNSLYKEKFNGALANKEDIELLILGNSHANYGVHPKGFDLYAYNLANVNQSFYFDKRITLKLLDSLSNLKYVLISADYHSLHFSSQGVRDIWSYYGNGVKYKDENYFLEDLSPSLFGYSPKVILSFLKRDIVRYVKYRGEGFNFPVQSGVNPLDNIYQGYVGYTGSDSKSFSAEVYQKRAQIFNEKVEKGFFKDEVKKDLKNFIEVLKARGIRPILFTTPTYSEYNSHLDEVLVRNNVREYSKISKEYKIPFWNFMDMKNLGKENFYDEDHLNKAGAISFARILNDSIKN